MMVGEFPLLTGQVVKLLNCKERRLHEAVRQGVVCPPVAAGRRLWNAGDVLKTAKWMGLDTVGVRNACLQEGGGQ